MEDLLSERVNYLRHSLFHLLNCGNTTDPIWRVLALPELPQNRAQSAGAVEYTDCFSVVG